MLTLVNTNQMTPPIGPLGLAYTAAAARAAGQEVAVVDLSLADDPDATLRGHFSQNDPELVGLSFRNVDDCMWPSGEWFVPRLQATVARIRSLTDAPIVIGGVGFAIFAERIVEYVGADFGVRGDGEQALPALLAELRGRRRFETVGGLVWRDTAGLRANAPAWPEPLTLPTARDVLDNAAYFRRGGQAGVETKRGCGRSCLYCPEPNIRGRRSRLRSPAEVADEIESLLAQGAGVLHLCDSEFNLPIAHAKGVCEELIRRQLGERVRWYAYLAVTPFDDELADLMRRAGCAGINFTGDATCEQMLRTYRQPHRRDDLARTVGLCRTHCITVMVDMLLGGPGETPATARESIEGMKAIAPDCAGASLGIRIYPDTPMADAVRDEGPMETNPSIRRKYDGPVDLFHPTFYISHLLGPTPAALIRELIADDERFFPPAVEADCAPVGTQGDHNYNDNSALVDAIAAGARGAYWDILRHG